MFQALLVRIFMAVRIRWHGLHRHMRVFSHTSPSERLALFRLAKSLPCDARALEIGSHIGSSALFLCAGLSKVNGRLLCVDGWMNETMPDGSKDTFGEFTVNTRQYAGEITPIRKYSAELTDADIGGHIDLAFIDGDHSEAAVRDDLARVSQWLSHNGVVVFHDVSSNYPGVGVVIGEAMSTGNWQLVQLVDTLAVLRRLHK